MYVWVGVHTVVEHSEVMPHLVRDDGSAEPADEEEMQHNTQHPASYTCTLKPSIASTFAHVGSIASGCYASVLVIWLIPPECCSEHMDATAAMNVLLDSVGV